MKNSDKECDYKSLTNLQMKAKEAIQKAEDTEILRDIEAAVRSSHTVTQSGDLNIASLNYAYSTIEQHDLTVAKVVMNPLQYADVRLFGRDVYDEATRRDVLMSGLFGLDKSWLN